MGTTIANQQEKVAELEKLDDVKVMGRVIQCYRRLREEGLSFDAFQWPIDDPEKRKRLVSFWMSGCYEATTSQKLAREIMGKNFLGVEEVVRCFNLKPTKSQLEILANIPWNEGTLKECKDSHILIAVFPFSVLEVRARIDRRLFYQHEDGWYNGEDFAKKKGKIGWHLIRRNIVSSSTNKSWKEQQVLLEENEETPLAQVMVNTIILKYLATGERIFEKIYVRCQDLDSGGRRVGVGSFDSYGLDVYRWGGGVRYDGLGLAAERKFPS